MANDKTKVKVLKSGEDKPKKVVKKAPNVEKKPVKGLKVLLIPLFAVGRYLRDSWAEIRLVRWPNRRATWSMTLSVVIYTLIFFVIIMILDAIFTFIFNKALG
ncbi:preprotein translocase subunit SecE [Candidatus Saccharibacteria bacterium]|nr:preprotein translocase subunit SecE [Candidatus Saccharibacteria bacterium]